MEMFTLDGDFQPASFVERYESLIWTERYSSAGDFQLTSNDIERMIKLLPRESLVTIRESSVPMIVETHKIVKSPKNAKIPQVVITGRSFETVLDRRATLRLTTSDGGITYSKAPWIVPAMPGMPSDTAYYAIRKIIGDVVDRRIEYGYTPEQIEALEGFQLGPQAPWLAPEDALPMIDLPLPADFEYVEPDDPTPERQYEIKPGNLYSVVLELLAANHHGLKAVRPPVGESKIAIEIYNGADLTRKNNPDSVVFDARFDQFDDATYLLSQAGSTNLAYTVSRTKFEKIKKTASEEPTGLDRRVLLVDISGEEGVDTPEARRTRALMELYKHNATALFDGQIAEQVAYGYNRNYFLGDIIRLNGEYGLSEFVRVAEFIRTDDSTGSKAYPTFETITDDDATNPGVEP